MNGRYSRLIVLGIALASVGVAGCGGKAHAKRAAAPATPCQKPALAAMAKFLSVQPTTISTAESTGNNAMPQCSFVARIADRKRVRVVANVDNGPSAYFRLERTIVEAGQIFGAQRMSAAPVAVLNLGLEASWFPQEGWLMSTDGYRIIRAAISWPGAGETRDTELAEAISRTYLDTPTGKKAQEIAEGYPSG